MFLLRLFITGLVALVPSADGKNLTLVVQELRADDPKHIPMLLFPCKAAGCAYDVAYIAKGLNLKENINNDGLLFWETETFGGVRMKGMEVFISNLPPGALSLVGARRSNRLLDWLGAVPQTRTEGMDISWVPSMKNIVPRAGTMGPQFIWDPSEKEVAGILKLHDIQGEVKSYSFSKTLESVPGGLDTFVRSLSFKTKHSWIGSPRQVVTDTAVIEIPIYSSYIELSVQPFGGSRSDIVKVEPTKGIVNVLIANLTPIPSVEDEKRMVRSSASSAHSASHFPLYLRLAETSGLLGEDEKSTAPVLGMKSRKILAREAECESPGIIKAVSLRTHESGGLHRTICTLVTFDEP